MGLLPLINEKRKERIEYMRLRGLNTIIKVKTDDSINSAVFFFSVDGTVKAEFFNAEEPKYSYYDSDDSYHVINEDIENFDSYKSAWIRIKDLLTKDYRIYYKLDKFGNMEIDY